MTAANLVMLDSVAKDEGGVEGEAVAIVEVEVVADVVTSLSTAANIKETKIDRFPQGVRRLSMGRLFRSRTQPPV